MDSYKKWYTVPDHFGYYLARLFNISSCFSYKIHKKEENKKHY